MTNLRNIGILLLGLLAAAPLAANSLFDEATYRGLTGDHRAHRVGDSLTVVIYESATAESSTDADTNKTVGVGVSASDGYTDINGNLDANSRFQGGGTLSRSDEVVATVSVTVTEVLPGGDLRVRGNQITSNPLWSYASKDGSTTSASMIDS